MASANLLTQAMETEDLDEALKLIMDALGITDGGVAGVVFSGFDANQKWADAASVLGRRKMMSDWINAELAYAEPEDTDGSDRWPHE